MIKKTYFLIFFFFSRTNDTNLVKEFFSENNYSIEAKIFKNCEHRIPQEGSSLGLEFIKKNLY